MIDESSIALIIFGSIILVVTMTTFLCKNKTRFSKRYTGSYKARKRLRRQRRREQKVEDPIDIFVIPFTVPENVPPCDIIAFPEVRTTAGDQIALETRTTTVPGTTFHEEYSTQPAYNPTYNPNYG